MMDKLVYHAFIDEFGGVSASVLDEPFLIVAAVVSSTPRGLELIIRRALWRFGAGRGASEMKATHSADKTIRWVLQAIAAQDVAILAVVMDKRQMGRPRKDPEDLYRQTAARAVRNCLERWPRLDVILDKRYTHEYLRQKLERHIREQVADVAGQALIIRQEDSEANKSLQIADFVAWALGQKYYRRDQSYYEIIGDRVVVEEIIEVK